MAWQKRREMVLGMIESDFCFFTEQKHCKVLTFLLFMQTLKQYSLYNITLVES